MLRPLVPARRRARQETLREGWDPLVRALAVFVLLGWGGVSDLRAEDASSEIAIDVCDGNDEWPPFSFFEREGERPTQKVVGFVPDLIQEALAGSRFRVTIHKELPWARCQAAVLEGKTRQIGAQAAWSESRAEEYLLTASIYVLDASYFFSTKTFPDGLVIDEISDLDEYRICGVSGLDYSYEGLDYSKISQSAEDYRTLVQNVDLGRCDVFLESAMVLQGLSSLQGDWLAKTSLRWEPLPGVGGDPYHVLISRKPPYAEELLRTFDAGLARLRESGRYEELWARYLAGGYGR